MVPFTKRIWYHIPHQSGTIFSFKMVPFSIAIWYHFLQRFRPYWKSKQLKPLFKISFFLFQNEYPFFFRSFSPFLRANGWKKWGGSIVSVMHKPHSVAIRITILLLYLTFLNLLRCGNNDGVVKLFNDFSKRSDMRTKEVGDVVVVKGCLIDNIL